MPLIFAALAPAVLAPMILASGHIRSTPDLGQAEGRCRANERGPSFFVNIDGFKDRTGQIKLEVYPANDDDFLEDDNLLIMAGKTFRRVVVPTPKSGPVNLCVRVPGPGPYSVMVLHDRDQDRKFKWTVDGVGFAGNPRLGWSKPKAAKARAVAGDGPTNIDIVLNYRRGFGMSPLK